jgi:hypothetical protein
MKKLINFDSGITGSTLESQNVARCYWCHHHIPRRVRDEKVGGSTGTGTPVGNVQSYIFRLSTNGVG